MAELKSCPFCGGTEIYAEVSYLTKEFRIYCANADEPCVAEMRLSFADAGLSNGEIIGFEEMTQIIKQLVEKWNTRTPKETHEKHTETHDNTPKKGGNLKCNSKDLMKHLKNVLIYVKMF